MVNVPARYDDWAGDYNAKGKSDSKTGTLNFGIRSPVHNVDEVAGFAIRKAAFRMQKVDMFKLLCEALLGLS